ncbi:hypothetical protein [Qipengyuania sphaerica]|uniref:hypothetical protein n=1 Tax=Qipengyuania sphaerica TaxID=2867243 RepID=UPI001C88B576|nr:hypothetical protein [Qipengyuania sphaerica]MBX7541182.1 hypothetical protein [Qipengyuania sphaerica]
MVDPELEMIFLFVLAILLISLASGYLFSRQNHRHQERKLELRARAAEAEAARARQENTDYSKMEERLRVLERIATDGNHALASQIEELRALDAIEDRTEKAK